MSKFKIENFCDLHNEEFKVYYNYLNNPFYVTILLKCLQYTEHPIIKNKILNMIIDNHELVLEKLNKIDIIISYYKENNLINKSEIGAFFKFYEVNKKNINTNNNNDLLKLFYKLINYEKCLSVLKECFYIFSEYRACIYFMTPSIDFNNTKKTIIKDYVIKFRDNINTLNQIISKVYIEDKTLWGSKYYSTAYAMFETCIIIKKYFKDPLKLLNIEFIVNKKISNNKIIIKNLCKNYHNTKFKESPLDYWFVQKFINSISQFIINIKRLGYDMWYIIPLVFNSIYINYEINGLPESNVFGHNKIYYQKLNNKIGLMTFILVNEGYISNTNIFQNCND